MPVTLALFTCAWASEGVKPPIFREKRFFCSFESEKKISPLWALPGKIIHNPPCPSGKNPSDARGLVSNFLSYQSPSGESPGI